MGQDLGEWGQEIGEKSGIRKGEKPGDKGNKTGVKEKETRKMGEENHKAWETRREMCGNQPASQ